MIGWFLLCAWSLGEIILSALLLSEKIQINLSIFSGDRQAGREASRIAGLMILIAGIVGTVDVLGMWWMQNVALPRAWAILVTTLGVIGSTIVGCVSYLQWARHLSREPQTLWPRRRFDVVLLGSLTMAALVMASFSLPLIAGAVPPNPVYGVRTHETLADQNVWYSANRIGGWALLVAEMVTILGLGLLWRYRHRLSHNQMGVLATITFALPCLLAVIVESFLI